MRALVHGLSITNDIHRPVNEKKYMEKNLDITITCNTLSPLLYLSSTVSTLNLEKRVIKTDLFTPDRFCRTLLFSSMMTVSAVCR